MWPNVGSCQGGTVFTGTGCWKTCKRENWPPISNALTGVRAKEISKSVCPFPPPLNSKPVCPFTHVPRFPKIPASEQFFGQKNPRV